VVHAFGFSVLRFGFRFGSGFDVQGSGSESGCGREVEHVPGTENMNQERRTEPEHEPRRENIEA
jgi:hypothetical protein